MGKTRPGARPFLADLPWCWHPTTRGWGTTSAAMPGDYPVRRPLIRDSIRHPMPGRHCARIHHAYCPRHGGTLALGSRQGRREVVSGRISRGQIGILCCCGLGPKQQIQCHRSLCGAGRGNIRQVRHRRAVDAVPVGPRLTGRVDGLGHLCTTVGAGVFARRRPRRAHRGRGAAHWRGRRVGGGHDRPGGSGTDESHGDCAEDQGAVARATRRTRGVRSLGRS